MARKHWWSFLVNEEGQPINNASVSIFLAGSTTSATVYLDEFSSESKSTAPQVTTNSNGYFEFWLPDPSSSNGYSATQKFKIEWNKAGIEYGFIDYVDVYPPLIAVDETDTDTTKDKSVSNYLANLWEAHRLDTSGVVHGIEEVNTTYSSNVVKNKLVSNSLAYKWDKHESLEFGNYGTSGSTYVMGTSATSADNPHGIKPLDLSETIELTDPQYWRRNRVISYSQGKKWDDHVDNETNPHGFLSVNENDSSDTTKNKLVSNSLMHYLVNEVRHSESVTSANWTSSGGSYVIDINHDLATRYPVVQMWNTDSKLQASPVSVTSLSPSAIRVEYGSNIDAEVIILK